ncbi:hypothetical protein V6N11_044554 [Hibiscus sabdariffa]|uniref:Uncharacterized protein n=2 Tax=Hibiscus sabdariffa TaxID=183260 RepID=A0ABR2BTQ1_9ROSI
MTSNRMFVLPAIVLPYSQPRIVISRDVVFEEDRGWDWSQETTNIELKWEDIILEDDVSEGDGIVPNVEEDVEEEPHIESEPSSQNIPPIVQGRIIRENRRAPVWQKDYESGSELGLSNEDEEVNNLVLYAIFDPITFEEAAVSEK